MTLPTDPELQAMTDAQLSLIKPEHERILKHMLGACDRIAREDWGYRDHFCAEIGTPDHSTLEAMVECGLVLRGKLLNRDSCRYYHTTDEGKRVVGVEPAEQTKEKP